MIIEVKMWIANLSVMTGSIKYKKWDQPAEYFTAKQPYFIIVGSLQVPYSCEQELISISTELGAVIRLRATIYLVIQIHLIGQSG